MVKKDKHPQQVWEHAQVKGLNLEVLYMNLRKSTRIFYQLNIFVFKLSYKI